MPRWLGDVNVSSSIQPIQAESSLHELLESAGAIRCGTEDFRGLTATFICIRKQHQCRLEVHANDKSGTGAGITESMGGQEEHTSLVVSSFVACLSLSYHE